MHDCDGDCKKCKKTQQDLYFADPEGCDLAVEEQQFWDWIEEQSEEKINVVG